mgnify:CR=1 FL=1
MKRVATALLLLGAWVSAPALAADEPEVYSASTTGEITVDVEGRVTALVLDHKELGADVMRAFEDKVRGWQFEPVLRDGAPVPAKARMTLELLLVRQVGVENLGIAFEDVQFFDPVERKVAEGVSASLAPPRYPEESLRSGIGARVSLVLKLDADGRVIDVAAQEVNLLGEESGHQRDRHAREFTRAAVRAASNGSNPRASKPATNPDSTSPEPAVASHGAARSRCEELTAHRPDGVAITVSAPLNSTTQPARAAAARHAPTFENAAPATGTAASAAAISANSRANSPECGDRMHAGCSSANSDGSRAINVSASASSTVGRGFAPAPADSTTRTMSADRASNPNPGPRHSALIR